MKLSTDPKKWSAWYKWNDEKNSTWPVTIFHTYNQSSIEMLFGCSSPFSWMGPWCIPHDMFFKERLPLEELKRHVYNIRLR